MSSPLAGKFQDHYIVLGVEPTADSDTIQAAYSRLAQKFHPGNAETGNKEKFDAVNQAFEVLSDPGLRASFDKIKGIDPEAGNPKFSGTEFFRALEQGAGLRTAVLCLLYDRRRVKSFKPSLSMRHLEGMLTGSAEDLNFALWYLKQRGFVANDDKSSLAITVEGMDFVEQNWPSAEMVMPFIKPDSVVSQVNVPRPNTQPSSQQASTRQPIEKTLILDGKIEEPVLNVLNRALQRSHVSEEAPPRTTVRVK